MIRESFNTNWFYCKEGDFSEKQPITLPHDAMLYEKRDPKTANGHNTGYFPGGAYRYSKVFYIPQEYQEKTVLFEWPSIKQATLQSSCRIIGSSSWVAVNL